MTIFYHETETLTDKVARLRKVADGKFAEYESAAALTPAAKREWDSAADDLRVVTDGLHYWEYERAMADAGVSLGLDYVLAHGRYMAALIAVTDAESTANRKLKAAKDAAHHLSCAQIELAADAL